MVIEVIVLKEVDFHGLGVYVININYININYIFTRKALIMQKIRILIHCLLLFQT